MGNRYFLTVECPMCKHKDNDVYYAPTCEIKTWKCKCGHVVDLEEYTGISEADCSNAKVIHDIVNSLKKK